MSLSIRSTASFVSGALTQDTFTETSDTAMESHTDDKGNTWSLTGYDVIQVDGATDKTETK